MRTTALLLWTLGGEHGSWVGSKARWYDGIRARRTGQKLRRRHAQRGGWRGGHGCCALHEQGRHVVGPCLVLRRLDKAPCAQVVGMAQRRGARVIGQIRLPMVMEHRPTDWAQDARCLPGLMAALGMDLLRRQTRGTRDRQPMQRPPHPQPRLVPMPPLSVAQQALHRFCGWGNARLQVLRSLPPRRCAPPMLPQVGTDLRRPLYGNRMMMGEGRRPGLYRRTLVYRLHHGVRQGSCAPMAPGRTDLELGARRRHLDPARRQIAHLAFFIAYRLDTL